MRAFGNSALRLEKNENGATFAIEPPRTLHRRRSVIDAWKSPQDV